MESRVKDASTLILTGVFILAIEVIPFIFFKQLQRQLMQGSYPLMFASMLPVFVIVYGLLRLFDAFAVNMEANQLIFTLLGVSLLAYSLFKLIVAHSPSITAGWTFAAGSTLLWHGVVCRKKDG